MEKKATVPEESRLDKLNYIATTCSPEQIEDLYKAFLEYKKQNPA
ncbi:hypothetical protein P9578_28460 [Brevibacillus choshinensis]|nr:hypothetical protein [Brevibacillus choshinensis]